MSGNTVGPYSRCAMHPACMLAKSEKTGRTVHLRHPRQLSSLLYAYIDELSRYHPNGVELRRRASETRWCLELHANGRAAKGKR